MKFLLDTCEFLWLVSGDAKLSDDVATVLRNPDNDVYLSVVSLWEISIRHSLGKLPLPQSPDVFVPLQRLRHGIDVPNLDELSVGYLSKLPTHHKDPFDRMLVCQAQAHGMTLVSSDPLLKKYSVSIL